MRRSVVGKAKNTSWILCVGAGVVSQTAITQASKILGTQNPQEILDYLIHGENHDELNRAMLARGLGELDEAQLKAGIDSMMGVMTEELQAKKKTQKTKTTLAADEKDAVSRLLQFGGRK
jgi:hypothetical protein